MVCVAIAAALVSSGASTAAQVEPRRWQAVAHALGTPGEIRGEAFRVEFAPLVTRIWIRKASLGPGAFDPPWVTFLQQGELGLMLGRLLLPAAQAATVTGKLAQAGIDVTAAVDPYPGSSPAVLDIYFREAGEPAQMASALHKAIGTLLHAPNDKTRASAGALDAEEIERVMGRAGQPDSGSLVFRVARQETVKCCGLQNDPLLVFSGIALGPATGFGSRIAFEGDRARATVSGRLLVKRDESGSVERALAAFGIGTTGLAEVFPDEQPRILFLHFVGTGKPLVLAQGLRAALERTGHASAGPNEPS